jgi:hypothetical protein
MAKHFIVGQHRIFYQKRAFYYWGPENLNLERVDSTLQRASYSDVI